MQSLTLIANWKMHGNLAAVRSFLHTVDAGCWRLPAHISSIFCPPAAYVQAAIAARNPGSRVRIGGQSISAHAEGAHTGQISAAMLADLGATHVLVGHSEDRAARHLSDGDVAAQAAQAIQAGLIPVICIGESQADYDAGRTLHVLDGQLKTLAPVVQQAAALMIAYEPIWAIGSGKTPKTAEIEAVHAHIHAFLAGSKEARDTKVPVLYGGSVKSTNVAEILALPSVNGALIGSASLQAEDVVSMAHAAAGLKKT